MDASEHTNLRTKRIHMSTQGEIGTVKHVKAPSTHTHTHTHIHTHTHTAICFADCLKAVLLLWILFDIYVSILSLLCCLSVTCSLVITCWERTDLLALSLSLVCCVFLYFVTFPFGVPGQVWYLMQSISPLSGTC